MESIEKFKTNKGDGKIQCFTLRRDVWKQLKKHAIDQEFRTQDYFEEAVLSTMLKDKILR